MSIIESDGKSSLKIEYIPRKKLTKKDCEQIRRELSEAFPYGPWKDD